MDKQDINFLILNGSLLILCPMVITFLCKNEISKNGILKNKKKDKLTFLLKRSNAYRVVYI